MALRHIAVALAFASAPGLAHSEPDDREVYDELDVPLFVVGAAMFGGTYIASVAVADNSDHPGAHKLYSPIGGPWLALRDWGPCGGAECRVEKALLVGDAMAQLVGVGAMIYALLVPSHHKVVTRTAGLDVVPLGTGLAVIGRF